ncbi:hypothetical protein [Parapedobacter tibetensis]|uniref:hypothetical protein n=1 Tax=Parapedobacter tibetensis TaxID=2972951 RepID=UPI00215359E5|nr:hypothetical protein [Parapedobacter tibetensis]
MNGVEKNFDREITGRYLEYNDDGTKSYRFYASVFMDEDAIGRFDLPVSATCCSYFCSI